MKGLTSGFRRIFPGDRFSYLDVGTTVVAAPISTSHAPINNSPPATPVVIISPTYGSTSGDSSSGEVFALAPISKYLSFEEVTLTESNTIELLTPTAVKGAGQASAGPTDPIAVEEVTLTESSTIELLTPTAVKGAGQASAGPTDPIAVEEVSPDTMIYATPAPSAYLYISTIAGSNDQASVSVLTLSAAKSKYLSLDGSNSPKATDMPLSRRPLSLGSDRKATPMQVGVIDGLQYSIRDELLYIDRKTFDIASPTVATLRGGDVLAVDPSGAVTIQTSSADLLEHQPSVAEQEAHVIGVTVRQYVTGAFVPTILAVLFSIAWHLLASALKEMEPFYQLQRPEAVSASQSLLLDYHNSINVVATITAGVRGHFLVWGSGLIALIVPILAPLASETVFIGFVGQGICPATSGRSSCTPRLSSAC